MTVFGGFLLFSLSILTLNVATRQWEAARCTLVLVIGQLIGQASIKSLGPPESLLATVVCDMIACVYFGWPWIERIWMHWRTRRLLPIAPPTWRLMMFFITYTVCLIHVDFFDRFVRDPTDARQLYDYGLRLNVAFAMVLVVNAWPGGFNVVRYLRRDLRFARLRHSRVPHQ